MVYPDARVDGKCFRYLSHYPDDSEEIAEKNHSANPAGFRLIFRCFNTDLPEEISKSYLENSSVYSSDNIAANLVTFHWVFSHPFPIIAAKFRCHRNCRFGSLPSHSGRLLSYLHRIETRNQRVHRFPYGRHAPEDAYRHRVRCDCGPSISRCKDSLRCVLHSMLFRIHWI